jgi:hypothetical protein
MECSVTTCANRRTSLAISPLPRDGRPGEGTWATPAILFAPTRAKRAARPSSLAADKSQAPSASERVAREEPESVGRMSALQQLANGRC